MSVGCACYPFCNKTNGASQEKCDNYIKSGLKNVIKEEKINNGFK